MFSNRLLYDRVLRWSRHPHAERYLGAMSFAESSFFPIPVDVMLAPMCLADRDRWIRYATIATVFSVLGGLGGYAIGWGMFEAIEPWLRDSHYWGAYEEASQWFDDYGVWVVFVAGVFADSIQGRYDRCRRCASQSARILHRLARGSRRAFLPRRGPGSTGRGDASRPRCRQYVERIGWATVVIYWS